MTLIAELESNSISAETPTPSETRRPTLSFRDAYRLEGFRWTRLVVVLSLCLGLAAICSAITP